VPYCLGKTVRAVRIMLERAGLEVGEVSRVSSARSYPEEVISTEPLPGVPVVKGSRVNLLVSTGAAPTRVLLPDLRRKSSVSVKLSLERLGLYVTQSSLDEDFNPLRAYVVLHKPPRGAVVSRGDTVTLFVSSSPRER
jgi:beta-lactam-binding protein with PASTA domain